MPHLAQLIARHDTLKRRAVIPAYCAAARANVFFPGPRVFVNSFPKAGTHLLSAVVGGLPRMMFSGVHRSVGDFTAPNAPPQPDTVDWGSLRRVLRRVNRGQYMTGHFPAVPGLNELLEETGYAVLVMIRDPRDIAVSSVHYARELGSHDLHRRYTEALRTDEERLMASIVGFPADDLGRGLEPIGVRLERYLPWFTFPNALVLRFEDLVGASGGGSDEVQVARLREIAAHVGRPLSESHAETIASKVWSHKSSTFRSGRSGGWRDTFNDEHIAAFKATAGSVLIDLGYERDLDW
jgi:hypothetical protein